MNPIQARERVWVWVCPVGHVLGEATEHPDDPAKPICDECRMGSRNGVVECERVPYVPLSHVQSLEAEVERLREIVRQSALLVHTLDPQHEGFFDDCDKSRCVLARAALDTTTEGK